MKLWERNLYSLWFGRFIAIAGLTMVMPFLPFISGSSDNWNGGGQTLERFDFCCPLHDLCFHAAHLGIMGDRYGRKPMVVRGVLGLAVAFFLMGFSHTVYQLLVFSSSRASSPVLPLRP